MPKRWTHEEKKELLKMFGKASPEELEQTFGAPFKNIRQVVYRMGVIQRDTILTAAALARAFNLPVTTVERWCKTGKLPALPPAPLDKGYAVWCIDPVCLPWLAERLKITRGQHTRPYLLTAYPGEG